jgi:hypothetical protein
MFHTAILIASAIVSSASLLKRQDYICSPLGSNCDSDYLDDICTPTNTTGNYDFNAPCNQFLAVEAACEYGANGLALLTEHGAIDPTTPSFSNSAQRDCLCQSEAIDLLNGCNDCFVRHGGLALIPNDLVTSASSSYCAVTNTPTYGVGEWFGALTSAARSRVSTVTSTFSDPLGNNSLASLYFTPAVTGTSSWLPAQATENPSNNRETGSSAIPLATSNGQIVATTAAAAATTATASGTASSASTTSHSGAGKQEQAAVAGLIGFAGLVVLL